MAISSVNPQMTGVRYVVSLYSGSSWTVPDGVNFINAKLIGGGGGGAAGYNSGSVGLSYTGATGYGGQITETNIVTTPGASISYSIGAGGTGTTSSQGAGNDGGSTTMTGATTATGGLGGNYNGNKNAPAGLVSANGGQGVSSTSSGSVGANNGGNGCIIIEYFK